MELGFHELHAELVDFAEVLGELVAFALDGFEAFLFAFLFALMELLLEMFDVLQEFASCHFGECGAFFWGEWSPDMCLLGADEDVGVLFGEAEELVAEGVEALLCFGEAVLVYECGDGFELEGCDIARELEAGFGLCEGAVCGAVSGFSGVCLWCAEACIERL